MRLAITLLLAISGLGLNAQQINQIDKEELPADLLEHIGVEYSDYEIVKVEEEVKKGTTSAYWVNVQKKKKLLTLEFGPNGNLLSKTKSKSYTFETNKPKKPSSGGDPIPPPMPNL